MQGEKIRLGGPTNGRAHRNCIAGVYAAGQPGKGQKMTYYIAETMTGGALNLSELWEKTKAQSLEGAKRAAKRRQVFCGTWLFVGSQDEFTDIEIESRFVCDAINMSDRGRWIDRD